MIKVAVIGAAGRMGKALVSNIAASETLTLSGAVEHPTCPALGQDAGVVAGVAPQGITITSDLDSVLADGKTDVVINFATAGVRECAEAAVKANAAIVIGATILTAEDRACFKSLAENGGRLVVAGNMSIGVNLLFKLAKEAALLLGDGADVEIIEMHHNQKKDAPSGTAARLAEVICEARDWSYEEDVRHGRVGVTGVRSKKEIGMHSLRGGDVVGDHTVVFALEGERVELTHKASNRNNFARGALRAAEYLASAAPGLYDMQDVLGLK